MKGNPAGAGRYLEYWCNEGGELKNRTLEANS